MFRLGIIGSDNTHAEAFSQLANLENGKDGSRIPDVQVTHIYGTDPKRTAEVAEAGKIPNIVNSSAEMIGKVDGVVCVWRHGGKHLADTLPLLKAGIPAFVDKPLACSMADARALIDAAEQAHVGFSSFSTLRYATEFVKFVDELRRDAGTLISGMATGRALLDSEYGGVFFYGIHAVELMNATFGYGCQSVCATVHAGTAAVSCKLKNDALVTLNLLAKSAQYVFHVAAFGTKGWRAHEIDIGASYYDGMKVFMDTLRNGTWPLSREQLLEPVQILCAIEKSIAEKREVQLAEV